MRPTQNNVVLKTQTKHNKSKGGLYLAKTADDNTKATVVAVGPTSKMSLAIGDVVVFKPQEGVAVSHNGETFVLVEDKSVLAVLN